MGRLRNRLGTPVWYIVIVTLAITVLIGYNMVLPYVRLASESPFNATSHENPQLWEIIPVVSYGVRWGAADIAGSLICLFLGLVCFLLGFARTINKLSGKQVYMQGLFLVLFAVNTLSMIESVTTGISPMVLFFIYWITFFIYPIPLFVYYFLYFAPAFQKWTWPLIATPFLYSVASFVMFFIFGLPFEVPDTPYTPISAFCFITFLMLGLFGVRQKSMAWFIRAISGFWFGWVCYALVKSKLVLPFYLHDEFKNGVTISAVIIVCFLVFFNAQELAESKSDLQILSLQNRLSRENYEKIKTHLREVGALKHEMKNHVAAMQMFLKDGRVEEAQDYLFHFAGETGLIAEAVYHDNYLINAVASNLHQRAKEQGIRVEMNLKPASVGIADPDLYSLLSNIIDNAVEACSAMPEGRDRFIRFAISERAPYLNICCKNSKTGEIIIKDGKIKTCKQGNDHGYGLWTIKRIVDAYDGMMNIDYDEDTFSIIAALKDQS